MEFADLGVKYISNYTTGPIQLICTKEVTSLAEIDGLKVRGSGPYGKTLSDFGAAVQSMGQAKVYQALESGLVECNQNYYYSMKAYKQYEVAPHVVELEWGQNMAFGIMMNAASFDALSADEQALITDLGSEFVDKMAELMITGKSSNKKSMVDGIDGAKISVVSLPEVDRSKLLEGSKKYVDAWVSEATEQGYDGAGSLPHIRGWLKNIRRKRPLRAIRGPVKPGRGRSHPGRMAGKSIAFSGHGRDRGALRNCHHHSCLAHGLSATHPR